MSTNATPDAQGWAIQRYSSTGRVHVDLLEYTRVRTQCTQVLGVPVGTCHMVHNTGIDNTGTGIVNLQYIAIPVQANTHDIQNTCTGDTGTLFCAILQ